MITFRIKKIFFRKTPFKSYIITHLNLLYYQAINHHSVNQLLNWVQFHLFYLLIIQNQKNNYFHFILMRIYI